MKLFKDSLFIGLLWLVAGVAITASATARVSLLTCGPGEPVYTLEGHSALRLQFDDGRDVTVNWGLFDFADPGFEWKFAKGRTDYLCGACPTSVFLNEYRYSGRSVVEQPINLSPEQTELLVYLVEKNLQPENVKYRYRYLSDNCATRPLNIIEQAIKLSGDTLRFLSPSDAGKETTFRRELRQYHVDNQLYQLFIDIALGRDVDRPITDRQRAFAPLYLSRLIERGQIVDPSTGQASPLTVGEPVTLVAEASGCRSSEPSAWVVVAPLLVWALATSFWQIKRKRVSRWSNALFFLLYGVLGVMVAMLMFWSEQEATGANRNLLWLNPLLLIVPLLIWWRKCRRLMKWAMAIFALATFLFIFNYMFSSATSIFISLMALAELLMAWSYYWVAERVDLTTTTSSSRKR